MASKLSHTAVSKYIECPYSYFLHYVQKIRQIAEPSTLTFGSCVDKAFSAMLIPGPQTPEEVFLAEWEKAYGSNPNATFSKSDLDQELMPIGWTNPNKLEIIPEMSAESLKQKGLLMIKALREKIMPQIEKVYAVQEPITLTNSDGDEFIGFIDLVVKLKGYDKPVIMDLKTSSVVYKPDSVKTSQQLTVYTHAAEEKFNTRLAGYIVLNKKIRKNRTKKCQSCGASFLGSRAKTCTNQYCLDGLTMKEPLKRCNGELIETVEFDVDTQIIVDEIPVQTENAVLELIDQAMIDIKAEKFEQNPNSCIHPIYRSKCPFYGLCYNNSMDGLYKKEDKK